MMPNSAFALLLQALGARVVRAAARVYGDGRLGPPFDHLTLIVRLAGGGGPWLADAGDGDVEVLRNGEPQYRIEPRERSLADFIPTCWWQQTAPESHFTQGTICSRLTEDGRVSISGRTLIRTSRGSRTEEELPTDDAVLAAYRDHFGIALDRVPTVTTPQGAKR